jgi:fibrillarin-like rRNA methylase
MMATIDTTSRRTWQNVNSKRRLRIQKGQEGKRHQKKIHQILSFHICEVTTCQHLAAFVFVPSVFGAKFPTAEL